MMDGITDDVTLCGPVRADDGLEVNQVQWCPETYDRPTSIKVDEQLPGPQHFIEIYGYWDLKQTNKQNNRCHMDRHMTCLLSKRA